MSRDDSEQNVNRHPFFGNVPANLQGVLTGICLPARILPGRIVDESDWTDS
jgi:hypothetical protein